MRRLALLGLFVFLVAPPAFADEAGVCADAAENGQKVRDKGHFTEAKELFTKCARKQCSKLIREDCLSFLDQLRKRQPSIVIRVADAAHHDIVNFRVEKDGKLLLDKASGTAIDTDPGEAKLHVEAEGYKPRDLPVVVAEGEQRRLVEIVLQPVGAPEPPKIDKPRSPPPPPTTSNAPGAATWITGGLGVAGFGVFGVFQALAASQYSDLQKNCPGDVGGFDCKGTVDAARTKYTVSAIGLGVGAAGLGTALILYLAVDRHAKPSPTAARFTATGIAF